MAIAESIADFLRRERVPYVVSCSALPTLRNRQLTSRRPAGAKEPTEISIDAKEGCRAAAVVDRGAVEAREDPVYLLQTCSGLHGAGRRGRVAHPGTMVGQSRHMHRRRAAR